jgi:RHS repeat-associated protein
MITTQDRKRLGVHEFSPFGVERTDATQETKLLGEFTGGDSRSEPMKFTGHERDWDGWLNVDNDDYVDYMHARYYDPNLGRFLSVDPTWSSADHVKPQTWNRYSYVLNNPINNMDPDGRCGVPGACPEPPREDPDARLLRQLLPELPSARNPLVLDPIRRPVETLKNVVMIATLVSPFAGDEAAGAAFSASGRGVVSETSGAITPAIIDEAMTNAPLQSTQRAVSVPVVQRYANRAAAGEVAPPIRVDGTRIVDGHHRYVAGRIVGREPAVAPGTSSPSARVYNWLKDVYKDLTDWGN